MSNLTRPLQALVTPAEDAAVRALAEAEGRSVSNALRQMLRAELKRRESITPPGGEG